MTKSINKPMEHPLGSPLSPIVAEHYKIWKRTSLANFHLFFLFMTDDVDDIALVAPHNLLDKVLYEFTLSIQDLNSPWKWGAKN